MWAFNILPWKENEFHSCKGRRCLRISYSAGFLFSLFSLPPIQFPDRCHLLWCSDIRKILMPKLYRPCMLLKHSGNRLQLESPPHWISGRTFGILAAALSALGCAAPALSWTLAGSLVLYINSAAACSAADCCLTGDVLASRGPSRWVPRHCRAAHSAGLQGRVS